MARRGMSFQAAENISMGSSLRNIDLNLLTVFDAVMQEQNITRAAHNLGMSQPAVSNAVARLKTTFDDELFVRHGRGIQPTVRAKQLFGPIRQALQLVKNELPSATFLPETSNRMFRLAVCSPLDMRFAPNILRQLSQVAPKAQVALEAGIDSDAAEKLRYQDLDFVIDYLRFDEPGFSSTEIFKDELVVVAAGNHPRIQGNLSADVFAEEKHASLKPVPGARGFAEAVYAQSPNCQVAYQGSSLSNMMYVVGQSDLIAVMPKWLAESMVENLSLQLLTLPFEGKTISGYLSWHDSSQKDKGHQWLREQVLAICEAEICENQ
ncbi:transcriptional regulator LeuO [Photobacterium sp. 1_MG-2023]|uniref:transcriptional regulator LeuO n=1 Tax=Photobacterium sp. 1_MG-2023 TaxID=3062646 RepID=UPI0026E2452B|nr:transcriptional regulator LeuO [Photobacterium sp. 1_MG-2023]MDO6707617.1 transcriptional regulator LeuO [Photobacterium sp. 1_MG-2023]